MRNRLRRWAILFCVGFLPAPSLAADDTANEPSKGVKADVVYGHKDGMALTLDVFEPKGDANGAGLMFMVSGGWVSTWNPPDRMLPLIQPLLERGYKVIAVRHGSSPRYVIPEIVSDVRLAHAFVHDHAKEWNIDPDKIGVFGFSAGGHLSLVLGTTSNSNADREAGRKARIAAVAAVFPPTDLRPYMALDNPLRERFPALKFSLDKGPDYSPLLQVSPDDAPSVLIHGDKDELVPIWHSEKMKTAFEEVKVPVELLVIQGAAHGFDADGNKRMFEAMTNWFDQQLLGKKASK
ncbi:Acetylxylan esterase precursor [Pirellula sp. SH-Sr6A]|uniref:alpha/beta hydrolase n=1 Tax=Pirellula sp. SH-Sr6A TaxID=1632865 RepID=UPI00078B87E3|nr:alpha/beta hydrolase [Pirellula sp. SH-Sr6A]AMV32280.1 Acetylxylan esterase precursor [Pirellula sp. SH-Sr6A]